MPEFIKKQRDHAEAKKIGHKVEMESVDKNGKVHVTERVMDSADAPRMVTRYMTPVGRKRGVAAPGTEDD